MCIRDSNIINNTTKDFKHIPSIDVTIANRYDQKLEDVQEWLSLTEWSQHIINEETILTVQDKLLELDIISKTVDYSDLIHDLK